MSSKGNDIRGQRFGRLTAIQPTKEKRNGNLVWECRCECGNTAFVRVGNLRSGNTASCGCLGSQARHLRAKDITGKRFGRLTAVRPTEERKNSSVVWECKCDCGNTAYATAGSLVHNYRKSCGCLQEEAKKNLVGQRFGRLTVIQTKEERRMGAVVWECKCDCGNNTLVETERLTSGHTQSCGCLVKEKAKEMEQALGRVDGTYVERIASKKIGKNNTSGVKGVCWDRQLQLWVAQIGFQRKKYRLGRYKQFEDAVKVRKKAEALLHDETVNYYSQWKTKANNDPAWGEANPIKIRVTEVDSNDFVVSFEPSL